MNRDYLWLLAFVTFVLGDLVTTGLGMHLGLVETHPLYSGILPGDLLSVALAIKFVLLGGFLLAYELIPEPARLGIPIGLSVLGTGVTLWNSYLILSVV